MPNRFSIEIRNLFLIVGFAILLGWSLGYVQLAVTVALLIYLVLFIRKTQAFFNWLESGVKEQFTDTRGIWGEITHYINKKQRRQNRTKEKYKNSLSRVTKITEALEQGIVILKKDFSLDWWNQSAAGILGLKKSDRNSPVINLMRVPDFVSFIRQKKFQKPLDLESPLSSGSVFQITASRVVNDDIVLVLTDVTQLRHLEQMRKDFVTNVSHELRTPLTVLKGYSETLPMLFPEDKKLGKAMAQMDNQINRMQLLTDDLLLLARMESEQVSISNAAVPLNLLLEDVLHQAELVSEGRHNITLSCESSIQLKGNKDEIYSALTNLVLNAVKHNPQGTVITIDASRSKKWVKVQIQDNGVGFDPIHISRLTERFYRVDSSRNAKTGGTGLGLAIVKHALLRHNGFLQIHSQPGKGSKFTCKFRI